MLRALQQATSPFPAERSDGSDAFEAQFSGEPPSSTLRLTAPALMVGAATLILSVHLLLLVDRFAVNLLTDDLWDIYVAFFSESGLWEQFRWKHLPHRQGLGNWFIALVNHFTAWDLRVLSFAMAATLIIACLLAIYLRLRVGGRLRFTDIAIPAAVLTTAQSDTLTRVPNPAHSVLPLILVLVTVLVWTSLQGWRRGLLIALLTFASAHTGFAFFLAPLLILRSGVQIVTGRASRAKVLEGVALLLVGAGSLAAFFVDYPDWWNWRGMPSMLSKDLVFVPTFIEIAMARFAGMSFMRWGLPATAVGVVLSAALLITIVKSTVSVSRPERTRLDEAIFLLAWFSAMYIFSAATGRVHISAMTGEASRYMTLLIPGFLAMYFATLRSPRRRWSWIVAAVVLAGSLPPAWRDTHPAADRALHAFAWKECYVEVRDIGTCTRRARFTVYPGSAETTRLQEKLDHLERRQLHIFAPD